ncbi:hypothetical protein GCM10009836_34590 [Pseudonocardia ailaonensis]|uniref:CoA transferase n=1 Tax=Pseudonocardia ailaonensis TaxID=367279 RepID=A0ABN2N423_9PSEU
MGKVSLLEGLRVLEVGAGIAVPFAGRNLRLMGAEVCRVPVLDEQAEDRLPAALRGWLDDGKRKGAGRPDASGFDLVIADGRAVDAVGPVDGALVSVLDMPPLASLPDGLADSAVLSAIAGATWAMGEVGRPPLSMPAHTAAFLAGVVFAGNSLGLLLRGESGRHHSSGLLSIASFVDQNSTSYLHSGIGWRREGRRAAGSAGIYPYGIYDCADGQVALIARSKRDWHGIAAALGAGDVSRRYPDPFEIAQSLADVVDAELRPIIQRLSRAEILETAERDGVLAVPVADLDDVESYNNLVDEREFWDFGAESRFPGLPFLVSA